MRILYVTDALAVWGGIERVLRDKMDYLVSHGEYEVHVITTDQGMHPIPYPLDERVHVRDLNIRYHQKYQYHGFKRLKKDYELRNLFLRRLKEAIEDIHPDLIIGIRFEAIDTIVKAKGQIPLICESHSMYYAYRYEETTVWNRLKFLSSRKNIRKADCIVALTEGDANDWRHVNTNVRVIPNIVHLNETGHYSSLVSKKAVFAGRFTIQKDIWSLLKVWKLVHQRHSDWELHAYGEGELKDDFQKALDQEEINLIVHEPTSNIFDKYLESSLLMMTSVYEPFGLVLPEAMSCGLPVVAFDCPYGPADIISDGQDGFLIKNRDIQVYADRVCQLIENDQLRRQMGERAVISSQRYLADIIMPQWESLFRQIVWKENMMD